MSSGLSPKLTVSGRNLPIIERTKIKNRRLKNKIVDIKTYETELDDEESQIEHVIANHYLDYKRQKTNKKFDRKLKRWRDVTSCFSDREILQIPSFSFPRFSFTQTFLLINFLFKYKLNVFYLCFQIW